LPITTIDGLPVGDGKPGDLTRRLADAYRATVRGVDTRHPEWLTELPV